MKKIHNKWLKGGLLGLLAIFGVASCSDDHFDLNTTNASGTLWQNLVATNQVDSFTMILEKTIVISPSPHNSTKAGAYIPFSHYLTI